jgi:electron transfer flavoprotein alpha subunit
LIVAHLLILAETDGARILPGTLPLIAFAQQWAQQNGDDFDLLLIGGPEIEREAQNYARYGAANLWIASSQALQHPTADRVAAVCMAVMAQAGSGSLAGLASSFGRDALPRVAARLDLPMLSDVMHVERTPDGLSFTRPMVAGNLLATVRIDGDAGVFSVRGTAYGKPEQAAESSPIRPFDVTPITLPTNAVWIGLEAGNQKRPDLTVAPVVVSGGRPLRDAETFERLLGGLADRLGGAVGATRAAVDSGIAPNELQVGQTGKTVAPQLYIAAGISGSVQHLAGMKDSRVIVAINTDPEAPIFEVADYGMVADLYTALPQLIEKLT